MIVLFNDLFLHFCISLFQTSKTNVPYYFILDICAFRLDFETFQTAGPTTYTEASGGACVDSFVVSSVSKYLLPINIKYIIDISYTSIYLFVSGFGPFNWYTIISESKPRVFPNHLWSKCWST